MMGFVDTTRTGRVASDRPVSWRSRFGAPHRQGLVAAASRLVWNLGYLVGRWEYLGSGQQAPRYRAVAAAIERGLTVSGAVLDIGCGSGVLARYLSPQAGARYVGIDVSPIAVAEAQHACAGLDSEVLVADLRSWVPHATAAILVFNETLYYMARPIQVVERYGNWLHPDGEIVVSMYHQAWLRNPVVRARVDAVWRGLARSLRTVDVQVVFEANGQKRCRVVRFARTNEEP